MSRLHDKRAEFVFRVCHSSLFPSLKAQGRSGLGVTGTAAASCTAGGRPDTSILGTCEDYQDGRVNAESVWREFNRGWQDN
jgi:hypothetical protein